ncbi:MAG: peptidyl-prolyl cis-trans isomerase [Alphaproteobacteria bacterium]|nr:peptidyl-prolyl cis-trans isomerase [Alphaproteobacteria bacterium]
MLDKFRKASTHFLVKLLFGLLAASFMIWGVGDFVRSGSQGAAAIKVGDVSYSTRAVNEEFNHDVARLRTAMGNNELTAETARKMGFMGQTIQRMVQRAILDVGARRLGIVVPDTVVRMSVMERREFKNAQGQFDRERFDQLIASNGYSEDTFFDIIRTDLLHAQLLEPVAMGAAAPKMLVESLYRHNQEKRIADVATIDSATLPAPPPPNEAAVEAFHKEHSDKFTAPEYRAVTALILKPADVAHDIEVTDTMAKNYYDQHGDEFQTPERRFVEQLLFDTKEQADRAAALVKEGHDLADAGRKAANKPKAVSTLGWVTRADLVPAELGAIVFELGVGKISEPVNGPLGWHIFHVTKSEAERSRTLAEVREKINGALRDELAVNRLYELSNKLEDALAGGAKVEEAAQQFNLKPLRLPAVDINGHGPDGKPVAGLPEGAVFLKTVFATEQGKDSPTAELNNGYFTVHVDAVTPPSLKPLTRIRAEVMAQWTTEQRMTAARQLAEKLMDRIKAGESLAKLAKDNKLPLKTSPPFLRTGDASGTVPESLIAETFTRRPGEAVKGLTNNGYAVAVLKSILAADVAADKNTINALTQQIRAEMAQDLSTQFIGALAKDVEVNVNRKLLEEPF